VALLGAGALWVGGRWTGTGESRAVASPVAQAPAVRSAPPRRRVEIDAALTARIRSRIAAALASASQETKGKVGPSSVTVAVHVSELGADGELVSIEANRAMRPASNLKLVTSSAALVLLGADFVFRTVVETEAPVRDGILRGDLVVRAAGDPLYDRKGDGSVDAPFVPVIAGLARNGIRGIEGSLVLDELDFAPPGLGPAWPDAGQH
jgi:D-alanyl-D-alanine carboxypeptidase/D-alanyl-D-alanine-endopeptidase (penicillin-binding protein 4)